MVRKNRCQRSQEHVQYISSGNTYRGGTTSKHGCPDYQALQHFDEVYSSNTKFRRKRMDTWRCWRQLNLHNLPPAPENMLELMKCTLKTKRKLESKSRVFAGSKPTCCAEIGLHCTEHVLDLDVITVMVVVFQMMIWMVIILIPRMMNDSACLVPYMP